MNNILKWSGVVALVLAIILIGVNVQNGNVKKAFGTIVDTSFFDYFDATTGFKLAGTTFFSSSGLKINSTSNTVARLNTGQCYIKAYATTIAATSTALVDCQATAAVSANGISALTGVTPGDNVVANLATTTSGSTFGGLALIGATASNTPGYIQLDVSNLTGTTFTWPTSGNATGTASYLVTH